LTQLINYRLDFCNVEAAEIAYKLVKLLLKAGGHIF